MSPEEIEAFKKRQIITNAVKMIQIHERARQARIYFFQVNKLYVARKEQQQATGKPKKIEEPDPNLLNNAATAVEKVWRGHHVKQSLGRREQDRRLLISISIS